MKMFKKVSLKAAIIPAALFVLIFCKTASSQDNSNGRSFNISALSQSYDRDGRYFDRGRLDNNGYDENRRAVLADDSHMYYNPDNDKRDNNKYNNDRDKKEYKNKQDKNRGSQNRDNRKRDR